MIKSRDPWAVEAEQEMEEEQNAITAIDRSRYLYKFRAFDSEGFTLKSLAECNLWCSHFKSFNDIFEFRFQYDRHPEKTDQIIEQWKQDFPKYRDTLSRKMVPTFGIEIMKLFLDDFGISCFTKDPLNPLLWSYYADSHKGMCLGFEFPNSDDGKFELESMHKVQYAVEPLIFDLLVLEDRRLIIKKLIPFVTTKHEIWKHEAEWRFVGYGKAKTAVPFRKDSLKEIIFGQNTPNDAKAAVKAVCEASGLNPRFLTAELNSWSYTLSLCERG